MSVMTLILYMGDCTFMVGLNIIIITGQMTIFSVTQITQDCGTISLLILLNTTKEEVAAPSLTYTCLA